MRAVALGLLGLLLVAASPVQADDDDTTICLKHSAPDADRSAACERLIVSPDTSDAARTKALLASADLFSKARRLPEQFDALNRAVKSDPTSWEALDRRGAMKDWYGHDRPGALADLDQAIKLRPTDYEVFTHRGDIRGSEGDYDGAIADYDMAIQVVAPTSSALLGRGRAKLLKRDYDGAIADLTRAINANSGWTALALARRCGAWLGISKIEAALEDCNRSIQIASQVPSSYAMRGRVHVASGDFDRAIADFNIAIERNSNVAAFYEGRGEAFEAKKNFENARVDYQTATTKTQPWYSAEDRAAQQTARDRLAKLPAASR